MVFLSENTLYQLITRFILSYSPDRYDAVYFRPGAPHEHCLL